MKFCYYKNLIIVSWFLYWKPHHSVFNSENVIIHWMQVFLIFQLLLRYFLLYLFCNFCITVTLRRPSHRKIVTFSIFVFFFFCFKKDKLQYFVNTLWKLEISCTRIGATDKPVKVGGGQTTITNITTFSDFRE